jgi:D-3-phosphoglycerate dehydrogenase
MPSQKTSFPKSQIKVLLLEGVHPGGVDRLRQEGFDVRVDPGALSPEELSEAISDVHILGIRSKTQLRADLMERARRLLTVGAFCIGTNQIDLDAALDLGIPVFNAPHSNTRSVAELVVGQIIGLMRGLYQKVDAAHRGHWRKSASGSVEIRGKTLGIVGYGHIGQQLSVLAEVLGMRVLFYDIEDKLALGNATRCGDLRDLLEQSDVVSFHVPGTPDTHGMLGADQLAWMQRGAFVINTSRGTVVDVDALHDRLSDGHIAGAALDVFPDEPGSTSERFVSPLQGMPNVLLTPHIGGSTEEAQRNIGLEVADKLIRFTNNGSSQGAVNFPNVVLPELLEHHRILHIHRNVPGVLQDVNALFGRRGINVAAQHLRTERHVGYLIMDTDKSATREMVRQLRELPQTIKVRPLF